MKRIALTQGKSAIVDDADFEWLSQWKWHAERSLNTWYAVRNVRLKNGKRRTARIHAIIMRTPAGMETDHRNGNGLDNRRKNLRIVTHAVNLQNRPRANTNSKSGALGINPERNGKWRATYRRKFLGYFPTKQQAVIARNNFIRNQTI